MTEIIRGYHFTADTLRNGEPIPPIGEWLCVEGPIVPCESGLHMSVHPFDALTYAPGALLHKVELRGELQSHGNPVDKWAGRERRIIATRDATAMLRGYACDQALSVAHLWEMPDIVRRYLETQDESIQAAARAAQDAAWAAWAAARAAQAAARAAWAAQDAARAAQDAARAAWAAVRDAAQDAAQAAARAAARAAWAAQDAARDDFAQRVDELFAG